MTVTSTTVSTGLTNVYKHGAFDQFTQLFIKKVMVNIFYSPLGTKEKNWKILSHRNSGEDDFVPE